MNGAPPRAARRIILRRLSESSDDRSPGDRRQAIGYLDCPPSGKHKGDVMTTPSLARGYVLRWFGLLLSLLLLSLLLLGSPLAFAGPPPSAQADFQRLHPCPANDARSGDCPGYVIDHVVPRCIGGPDDAYNMRWQTLAEAKARIAAEARRCPRNVGQVDTRFTL
jgi:hypothetical protein